MKTFTALLLLSALTAYVSASEMEFHRAVFDFLDERHDEKMAQALRDQGFSKDALIASDHPEPPQWMVSKHILFYVHSKHSFLITFRFSRYGHAGLNLRPLSYILYHGQYPMSPQISHVFSLKAASTMECSLTRKGTLWISAPEKKILINLISLIKNLALMLYPFIFIWRLENFNLKSHDSNWDGAVHNWHCKLKKS